MSSAVVSEHQPEQFLMDFNRHAAEALPAELSLPLQKFAAHYFSHFPIEELAGRRWSDLVASVYQWWQFIQDFDGKEPKIRLFNPTPEKDLWACPHTVLAVLQNDMPFLVDSIRIELNRRNIAIYAIKSTVLFLTRDAKHHFTGFRHEAEGTAGNSVDSSAEQSQWTARKEALIVMEINAHTNAQELAAIAASLRFVLHEVDCAVSDYQLMRAAALAAEQNLEYARHAPTAAATHESREFLRWLVNDKFTFLGYSEYEFRDVEGRKTLCEVSPRRLGLFSLRDFAAHDDAPPQLAMDAFNEGMARFHLVPQVITFSKSSNRARVHRHAYSDYIIVKRFNALGEVVGEARFLGLYTSAVYLMSPYEIPLIGTKVAKLIERSGLPEQSHDGKNFRQLLETFPRSELFLSSAAELYETVLGVLRINERSMVRLFMRRDPFGKFMNFIVYVPRDNFSTNVRLHIQRLIGDVLGSHECEFTTYFSESILARVYLVFKVDGGVPKDINVAALQAGIAAISRSWQDALQAALAASQGEEASARLLQDYRNAFSASYQEQYDATTAVQDIESIAELSTQQAIALRVSPNASDSGLIHFRIFHRGNALALSDVIPVLENLGFRVMSESSHDIHIRSAMVVWLHDFHLAREVSSTIDLHAIKDQFTSAFAAIWNGRADNDPFNALVTAAGLHWRDVVLLRAYAAYMHQTLFPFSANYIAAALSSQAMLTHKLVELFALKFDPQLVDVDTQVRVETLRNDIIHRLDAVANLNDDRIIRRFLVLIENTLRTNFYQLDEQQQSKDYLAIKLSPQQLTDIPAPKPLFEIFVFSPRMEGVHLRMSKVARGGLRWSDRLQDYRTEVLGLVKAQQVKNAVIVPSGAKGGFICKKMPASATREQHHAEGTACYQVFIRGLLDLTDNWVENCVRTPHNLVRYDDDDAYLVVAADKGTATFSDIANAISAEYGYWLGDAFASGGSRGYDHKAMGITARGAWISVQRHFREKNIDVQTQPITVIGIGDMAGDVFGNGMLLSQAIELVAAFNHQHIFIDPNPDPKTSFVERQRLFITPRSTWDDYNRQLISEGGGVFSRSAKSIAITSQMRMRFALDAVTLTPTELINALLKSPVDLIWNGGIGTYVKASSETHADVGDKANDNLRVNGNELRCKVFGEGGNLGMSQRGRIEYCLHGGACNTDFIDNAGGVDCSDHEVNIKILLNEVVAKGELSQQQRDQLLVDMTDNVAQLVLHNNLRQTQAISVAQSEALQRSAEYRRFMVALQSAKRLDRKLEFLPSDDALLERQTQGNGLTRPELAILISYAKAALKEDLTNADLTDDDYMLSFIETAFPKKIVQLFPRALRNHRLRREIVATQVANDMVNTMGISFAHRLMDATGASIADVAKAYVIARDIYAMPQFLKALDSATAIDGEVQLRLITDMMRKIRRATRWFLRNRRSQLDPANEVELFAPGLHRIGERLPQLLDGDAWLEWESKLKLLCDLGLPEALARRVAHPADLYSGLGIVEAARVAGQELEPLAQLYFSLGNYLSLPWFATQISNLPVENYWQAMAREAYLSDLESQLRSLSIALMRFVDVPVATPQQGDTPQDKTQQDNTQQDQAKQYCDELITRWSDQHQRLIARWRSMVNELQAVNGTDFAMIAVALRDLLDLAQATQHGHSLGHSAVSKAVDTRVHGQG